MGTGVSISKDNGKTWSKIKQIFEPGRHHPDLVRLPNGNLVMTVIRRIDIQNGRLVSYRRGCDAVISRDNGLTWDTSQMYILDDFAYLSGENWVHTQCGHLCSLALDDGSVLTTYGNYFSGGALIYWQPE